VGILDVERMKVKTHLRTPHKKEVYSLVWQDHFIYFIVNRVFGFFDLSKSKTGEYRFLPLLLMLPSVVGLVLGIALPIADFGLRVVGLLFTDVGQVDGFPVIVPRIPCYVYPVGWR